MTAAAFANVQPGGVHDRMRFALAQCSFPLSSAHGRFAREVGQMHLHAVTERQWRHVVRLAWRYRRQLPRDLVPSRDAVEALDAGTLTPIRQPARRPARRPDPAVPAPMPLFEGPAA